MDIMVAGEETVVIPDPSPPATYIATPAQGARLVGGHHSQFEGADIAKVVTKLSGQVEVELDQDISLDDRVRICGEFRVKEVRFGVDPKDGSAVRIQVLAPLADTPMQVVPFDSTNPNDNGIVRMRP